MKKQVLAIILATLLILTTFVSCGKKYLVYTDPDGVEHPVLTDAEGNTMVNKFGQIVVGVTDSRGRLVTDENGENETRGVVFPSSISNGNLYETPDFKWEVPSDLWYFEGNTLHKKDSDIYLEVSIISEQESLAEVEESFDNQLSQMDQSRIAITKKRVQIEAGPIAMYYTYDLKDENGELLQRREDVIFEVANGTIYRLLLVEPAAEAGSISTQDLVNMIKFR